MIIDNFDTDKEILFIAEIGNNHEGNFALAQKMVLLAAEAGANAVKFQTFRTELFVSKKDQTRFDRLKSFELSFKEFEKLSTIAKDEGLLFISTPLDLESAAFLKEIVCAYKIASGDNNFYPLLKYVAETDKPVIISSGLTSLDEINMSVNFIKNIRQEKSATGKLAVLHCTTAYPAPPEQANISAILKLKKALDCTIGYSDHTLGMEASLLAIALGARIIEKHFTIDKNKSDFRDHKLSADPPEFSQLIARAKDTLALLGSGEILPQKAELELKDAVRRSIVARHKLAAGTIIGEKDLLWIRPGNGLSPGQEQLLLGKKLSATVEAGEPIFLHFLQDN